MSIEQIESDWKATKARIDKCEKDRTKLQTHLDREKKDLKEKMHQCKVLGVDPDNIQEEARKAEEVFRIKMSNCNEDLKVAEEIMAPLIREIE